MRTKTVFRSATAILLAFWAAGCDKETNTELSADTMVPVEIVSSEIIAGVQTRAASTIQTGSIGVFRMSNNGYGTILNAQYDYSSGWKPNGDANIVYVGGANATLCAYYPYGVVSFNNTTCTLSAQLYNANRDLCYATTGGATVCNKTPRAVFTMKRAYARVKLFITRQASYGGNCRIASMNLMDGTDGFYRTGTLYINSGYYNFLGTWNTKGWTAYLNNVSIADGVTNESCDVLIPPQTIYKGLVIKLNIDGVYYSVTVPSSSISNYLDAGKQYNIRLTISGVGVTLNGPVNITDMVTGTTGIENVTPVEII